MEGPRAPIQTGPAEKQIFCCDARIHNINRGPSRCRPDYTVQEMNFFFRAFLSNNIDSDRLKEKKKINKFNSYQTNLPPRIVDFWSLILFYKEIEKRIYRFEIFFLLIFFFFLFYVRPFRVRTCLIILLDGTKRLKFLQHYARNDDNGEDCCSACNIRQ